MRRKKKCELKIEREKEIGRTNQKKKRGRKGGEEKKTQKKKKKKKKTLSWPETKTIKPFPGGNGWQSRV